MSASPGTPGKSLWSEYKNSEGRVYWSHATTKQSVWEKPDELRSPFELALGKTNWKQYVSKDRPYYVNSLTKETKWELPPELKELKRKVEVQSAYEAERERRKARGQPSPTPPPTRPVTPENLQARSSNALAAYDPAANQRASPAPYKETVVIPPGGFLTHDKAEAAFVHLLKREGVDETWMWDQTMRKIIMDPLYKALDTLAQKKTVFEKYTAQIVEDRRADKEARILKLRPILHRLFAASPDIKGYSTMKTADKVFARDRHWREAKLDERRLILEEYVTDLRKREETTDRELRTRNIQVLGSLLRQLDISVSTRWRAAHDIILSSPSWRADPNLQKIDTIDMLGVYDDYSRQLEQEHEEESRRYRIETIRRARKGREGFKALLHELKDAGELTRLSNWKETLPKIKEDERYTGLLGLPGSTPLDLWMDIVDDMSEEAERTAEKIEKALAKEEKGLKLETTFEEFEGLVKEVHMESQIDAKLRRVVYDIVHGRLAQIAADEARRADRKRRHRIDDLRYALKKVQRHLDLDMTYEEAIPHMQHLNEFKDIPEEEDRRSAFEKYVKRQKEKMREAESSEVGSTSDRRYSKSHKEEMEVDDDRPRRDRRERGKEGGREKEKAGRESGRDRESRRERSGDRREHRSSRRDDRERERERDRDHEKDKDRERRERRSYPDGETNGRESKRPRVDWEEIEKKKESVKEKEGDREDVEEGEI